VKNTIKNLLFILLWICPVLYAGESSVAKPGMVQVHGGTLFWAVVTFVLLLLVLKKVAWGPIISALESRETEISEALENAKKARDNTEKASQEYNELINKARSESQQMISESKISAEKIRQDIKENAENEAKNILENAKSQINSEREKAIQEIKSVVVDFSIQAASKVIEKNLDSKDNLKIIDDAIEGIGKV
jgi:F-type H+-transporting ATPase subunit b